MRDIDFEAVFGRELNLAPADDLRAYFAGRRILITGAAGTVGSALALRLAELGCGALGLLDHADHKLLEICERVSTQHKFRADEILCSVRERGPLSLKFEGFAPDIVIHAAALKHVHLGERHPIECVRTNLFAVRNAVAAAASAGAQQFILVSTDKAAAPVCTMGATKRLSELFLDGVERETSGSMRLKSVRFGNVFCSQGSVVERFMRQIEGGGPVTITDLRMTRYFMAEAEAADLVLRVAALVDVKAGRSNAYCLDMGEAIGITDLASRLMDLAGKKVDVVFTRPREGEKFGEVLSDEFEILAPCGAPGVQRISQRSSNAWLSGQDIGDLEILAQLGDEAGMRERVFSLLSERLGRGPLAASR